MSTMTLRKRIALVAVAALGAGVLSVAPAHATLADDTLSIGANSTTGAAVIAVDNTVKSTGLLATGGSGVTQTATLLSSGTLVVGSGASGSNYGIFTVVGGSITGSTGMTVATNGASAVTAQGSVGASIAVKPNSGAATMTVSLYVGASATVPGTLTGRVVVTITSTNAFGVVDAAESTAYWGTAASSSSDTATTNATLANFSKVNDSVIEGTLTLADAYGNTVTTGTGLITATVTACAVVNLSTSPDPAAGTNATAFVTHSAATNYFSVAQKTSGVPCAFTLTLSYNATVLATKSGTISGEVATVTLSSPKIGKAGTANTAAATIAYADALGNTLYPSSGTTAVSSTLNTTVLGLEVGTYPVSGAPGAVTMTCGSATLGAVTGLQMQHLNASGTIVKSNTWNSGCADVPYSVVASWDKASYAPGSIATLTLAFKDRFGNAANAYDAIGANSAGTVMTVTGGPSETAITAIAAGDKPSGVTGNKTYQFVVGATEGDFVAIIVPTEIQENTAARGVTTANISLPYSVKSTSTATSNADVLKAIVSLIASINKQIAALQKALLRR
jgi:trimeric autotransporter adhesin